MELEQTFNTLQQRRLVAYIMSNELAKISSLLPSNRKRSIIVHSLVNAIGLTSPEFSRTRRMQVVLPRRASIRELSLYHSRDYLDFILDPDNSNDARAGPCSESFAEYGLQDDCPLFDRLPDYVHLIAGASLTAVDALRQPLCDIAICWDGGRHHAQKARASGYCYVADCVLAILALKRLPIANLHGLRNGQQIQRARIMYLDLDLHFSDGVSKAFLSSTPPSSVNPQILTMSIHHSSPGFFPVSPLAELPEVGSVEFDPFSLSIPLRQGASNSTYKRIWELVERVKDVFEPEYIVVQCGTDALAGDPCATFNWSLAEADGSMNWCINRLLNEWKGKKLLLGGGGYNPANTARAWAHLTSIALNNPIPLETEIPDHTAFPMYKPSFTLEIPPGNMHDHNSDDYLHSIETRYNTVITALRERLGN